MISSMTGFGRCEMTENGCRISVEVRSLNNRYLDIFVKIPRRFGELEDELKNIVREELSRGKIDISVNIEGLDESIQQVSINLPLAKQYFAAVRQLEKTFNAPITLKPENLLSFDDIFERNIPEDQAKKVRQQTVRTLKAALSELKKHKREEGKNLAKDSRMRLERITGSIRRVRKLVRKHRVENLENLRTRIIRALDGIEKVDPVRLELEAAIMAERFDVSEECVRLESHVKLFRDALNTKGAVGRRLEFILQEMNREANTIAAKSGNFTISEEVVRIKQEVDRLKEQIRNVE